MSERAAIQRELTELIKIRNSLNERIAFFEGQLVKRDELIQAKNGSLYSVVDVEGIRPYVQEWIDNGGTVRSLADKAMVSEKTLYNILQKAKPTVREITADAIITALGVTHVYNSLVPDPPESVYYEE